MAVQVNVFGQQVGAVDLLSPDERLKNILDRSRNGTLPLTAEQISNASRFGIEEGAPSYFDQTNTVSGGTANSPYVEFDRDSKSMATVRNKTNLEGRKQQQLKSYGAAEVRRPLLGQNEEFTPEVQAFIDEQTMRTGINPVDNLTQDQINAAKQTGLITVKGGITHLTADEKVGGRKNVLPPRRGDIARFFSPAFDPEEIVGQPDSNDPSLIPTGLGGVSQRGTTNRDVGGLGAWTQMSRRKVVEKVEWLRGVRKQVEDSFFQASIDPTTGQLTELGKMLEKEFGAGAATNPSIAGIMTAAYYSALNDSRFAKYSRDEMEQFERYRDENEGKNDPRLWESTPEGRSVQTPMLSVLTEAVGENLEKVGAFKFSSPQMKGFLGEATRKVFQNLGSEVSFVTDSTSYMGPDSGIKPLSTQIEGTYPIRGISFEKTSGKKHLGEIMGIINALNPGKRKNANYSAPAPIPLDQKDPQQAQGIGGISSVRNSMINILQNMPNKLDPYVTNLLANLIYEGPEWNHIVANVLKIKEDGVNILLQQSLDVKNNGGIFFNKIGQQRSGRHASQALAGMQNLNGQRIATIPPTPELIKLSNNINPKNYTNEEKIFVAGVMAQLGFNDWGDNLSGNDNLRYSSIERRWQQLLDPQHELRQFQEKMLKYEEALRTNKTVKAADFGIDWSDGSRFLTDKNSMQALWSINEFLKAKEKGSNEFLDPYVTGMDSNQNGLFGIGVLIGDIKSTRGGGARTETYNSPFFKNETGILEEDKTYMQTLGMARSIFLQEISENKDLSDFADLFFANGGADKGLDNLFKKEFAKKVVVGGQYGEMEKSSATSMRIGFLEWLERVDNPLSQEKIRDQIMADINKWAGVGGADVNYYAKRSTRQNMDEAKPVIYFKKNPNDGRITNKIAITGKAYEQMHHIAQVFNMAMHEASPSISVYTNKMKDIYTTMVELAGYSNDNDLNLINGVELTVLEPDVTDPTKPIYNKEGYANDWKPGAKINLLDSMVEEDWVSIPLEGWAANQAAGGFDEAQWQERKVWLRKGSHSYDRDLDKERQALDYTSPVRPQSAGLTRFPVASLHILDDLAMSITIHEMKRKYGDEFDWFNSIWDEGLTRKGMREKFADEYNKAWMAVLLKNNYFSNMSNAFKEALENMSPEYRQKIYQKQEVIDEYGKKKMVYVNPRSVETFEILQDQVDSLVNDAKSIQLGNNQRGNVDKIKRNYEKYGTANVNANTPKYEKQLKMVDGEMVAKRTREYNQRDPETKQFTKSLVKSIHPGLLEGASQKDRLEYIRLVRQGKL